MSNGVCVLAQNNKSTDYVRQTYALALSILAHNPNTNISLITNDDVANEYKDVFDKIIPIPWGDSAQRKDWKIDNRWKVYHTTPYRNTMVFDADMLVLENVDNHWQEDSTELTFTGKVSTYRNETVTSNYYRKTFESNNLPNVYSAMYMFRKCEKTKAFFILLELIMKNHNLFYKKYAPSNIQKWNSVDLSAAIALKILDRHKTAIDTELFNVTHMKPYIQNCYATSTKWTDFLTVDLNDSIMINGYKQKGIFHYVEDEFLTQDVMTWLKEKV
jgi:hypothetical protein